ncbi:MAG TPA: autotransporter domain-containing protein [Hyphomonadaceae bacterium]|nr:autotransporter domain-containing protein [Hyphomonadaceae bacterium]
MQRTTFLTATAAMALVGVLPPAAEAQIFKSTLSGGQEIPAVSSTGSGTTVVALNSTTHEMTIRSIWSGLVSNTAIAHIHCCVVQPGNAGVATTIPSFPGFPTGVRAGSYNAAFNMLQAGTWNPAFITANGGTPAGAEAAFIAGMNAGRTYFNIHTVMFPGGEIRGNLVRFLFADNPGLGVQSAGAAEALDSLGAGTGPVTNDLLSLAILDPAQLNLALEQMSPSTSRGLLVATTESMGAVFDQIGDRLDGLRVPRREGSDRGPYDVWTKIYGGTRRQDDDEGFAGYTGDGWGVALGVDRSLSPNLIVGAALSYSKDSLSYDDQRRGSKDDIDGTQISAYASQEFGAFYLDYMAAYVSRSVSGTRASVPGFATADYDGDQFGVRVDGGWPIAVSPGWTVTPQASLDWSRLELDDYTETGGGALGLAVESRSADALWSSLGAELEFESIMSGAMVRPFARAHWLHNFEDDGLDSTAAFVAGGASFTTLGQPLEDDSFVVGAGVNLYSGDFFSAGFAYDATLSETYQSHVLQARARWVF